MNLFNSIIEPTKFRALWIAHLNAIPVEILVMLEFMDVFKDFLRLPIDRIVELIIDLILGIMPISQAMYQIGLAELEEMKD